MCVPFCLVICYMLYDIMLGFVERMIGIVHVRDAVLCGYLRHSPGKKAGIRPRKSSEEMHGLMVLAYE